MRRQLQWLMFVATVVAFTRTSPAQNAPAPANPVFVHPGILHTRQDLDRIRDNVKNGVEPWATAWRTFNDRNKWIAPGYTPRPLEIVGRGVGATGQDNISNDCTAAYYNAIAWVVTGDEAYAKKSIEIMNAWSYKCRLINGKDAVLCAGIYGYKLMNAAEIIRATYPGWSDKDIAQFKVLARDVFYPVIRDFATFANGNWDAAAEAAMMSIAIFLDDRPMFDRAARYYLDGSGDGSVLHYIISETGQLQESGRDQGHAQLGIGLLSCAAEPAYVQGIDLYAAYDNRLLKGFEYTATYNLKEQVPFEPTIDRTGKYVHQRISAAGDPTMQIYEMVFHHYANVAGVPAPWTQKAAAWRRPETLAVDQVGAGTLLFTRPAPATAAVPNRAQLLAGPVIAKGSASGVSLLWPASLGAASYRVQRAAPLAGPWETIAQDLKGTTYDDKTVAAGKRYFYRVAATDTAGTSGESLVAGATAGLPAPLLAADIGNLPVKGAVWFDGETFTLEASGAGFSGKADAGLFVSRPMNGDGEIVARYVPQTPSQFARMGLMMRADNEPGAPRVALLITPRSTADIEVPHWHVELSVRTKAGEETTVAAAGETLDAPFVTWGRLMAPFWIKLSRRADLFTASFSADGANWNTIGQISVSLPGQLQAGIAGCSAIKVSTTIMFDHVLLAGLKETK